jgi:uncharacterized membrane protein
MTDAPETRPAVLAAGARCAIHPDLPAETTCQRCGNYMCRTCVGEGGLGLCLACQQRSGTGLFPFDRDHYSLDGLFSHSVARFKQHWAPLVLATAGFFVLVYGIAFIGAFTVGFASQVRPRGAGGPFTPLSVVFQVVQVLVQLGLQVPLFALCLDVAEGKEPAIGAAFERIRRLPAVLLQVLIIYLVLGLAGGMLGALGYIIVKLTGTSDHPPVLLLAVGGLSAFIPAVYLFLGAMFGMVELIYNPEISALGALRKSFQLVEGQRWPVLGISLLSGVVALAGVLACCIGIVASMPLSLLLYCSLFLALRHK